MQNILQNLQNLNFSQYESKAYLALLQRGEVTGYELAKNSGIPASKIYQVVNKLIAKEVVLAIDSEPVRYAPIPPDAVLTRLKDDYMHNLNNLTGTLNQIYNKEFHSDHYIWNISGRDSILNRVIRFINIATREIHLSVWDEEVSEIEEALMEADRRRVKLSIVHYGQKKLEIGREFRHGREHRIREERGARRIALEADEEWVILGHFLEDGNSHAVWTSNKGLVLLAKDYIIHDIYTIRFAERFGDAANDIFEKY
jgi:sugar-specific transcriptional regulator TrmB